MLGGSQPSERRGGVRRPVIVLLARTIYRIDRQTGSPACESLALLILPLKN